MNARSIQDCVRSVPSFHVRSAERFQGHAEERNGKEPFSRVTFCEGLISDVEPSFLGLTDIEVTNENIKGFGGNEGNEGKYGVIFRVEPSIPGQVRNRR